MCADLLSYLFCGCVGCCHCKAAKPKFQKAAELMTKEKDVAFLAVDCTNPSNQNVCIEEGVEL